MPESQGSGADRGAAGVGVLACQRRRAGTGLFDAAGIKAIVFERLLDDKRGATTSDIDLSVGSGKQKLTATCGNGDIALFHVDTGQVRSTPIGNDRDVASAIDTS